MKQVEIVIDSHCSKEDVDKLREVRKDIKGYLDEITSAMEVINEVITFDGPRRIHHSATAMRRISRIELKLSIVNYIPQITATFFARGLIDGKHSIIEAMTFAAWVNGWIDFDASGNFGDFGNGTSKAAYTFDIYRSSRG